MKLSEKALREFKRAYEQEFKESITDEEAERAAERLVRVIQIILQPLPSELRALGEEPDTGSIDELDEIDTL